MGTSQSTRRRSAVTVESRTDAASSEARSPADRRDAISLKLAHIHATLDLLAQADPEHLCDRTIEAAVDGLMAQVLEVQSYVDGLRFDEKGVAR